MLNCAHTGRQYYRIDNGSVMLWYDNNVARRTIILDAKYRFIYKWSSLKEHVPGLATLNEGYSYIASSKGDEFSDPSLSERRVLSEIATDTYLDSRLFLKDPNTSSYNTEKIVSFDTKSVAAVCKERGFALPNIQTLVRIFSDSLFIDSLDPTVVEYPQFSLNAWFSINKIPFCWSSTEYDYYYAFCILQSGLVGCFGKNDFTGGVVPIIEL